VDLQQVSPGLWRWTAPHPDWEASKQEGDPADWPRDVGSVAYETAETLVLIDPLVPSEEADALDELAERKDRVAILTTLKFHRRSRDELVERYDAATTPPAEVEAIEIPGAGETMYWIPEHRALVPGDRILGNRTAGLRMCSEQWLRYLGGYTQVDLRAGLRPLLDLPVEMVLVSHGEPVLSDGHDALERALA
jgi:hypothetical protein